MPLMMTPGAIFMPMRRFPRRCNELFESSIAWRDHLHTRPVDLGTQTKYTRIATSVIHRNEVIDIIQQSMLNEPSHRVHVGGVRDRELGTMFDVV